MRIFLSIIFGFSVVCHAETVSAVVFIDPRVGPYQEGVITQEKEGYVYDWDARLKKLVNGESTTSFFERLSTILYGEDQSGKGE